MDLTLNEFLILSRKITNPCMANSPVLFVSYGGGHVAMLAPIALKMQAAGLPFIFLALTTAKAVLDRLGIPSIGFRDLSEANDYLAQRWGRELAADIPVGGPVKQEETIAYLGASFRDLAEELGEVEARRQYAFKGRHAFLPVATMRRVIARLAPTLVVATNSPRMERAAILASGQLGVPSVCAVDMFALQEVQWIGQPRFATRVCVINESVRNMFLAHGRGPEEVVVTGNPAFEILLTDEAIQAGKQLRHERGWNDGKKSILWASMIESQQHPFNGLFGDPALPRRIESVLRKIVESDENLRLVVRYHPSEVVNFESGQRVDFSPNSEPISALLHAIDCVVVTASTVGLEAAIAGRPVVSIDTSIYTPDTLYSSIGVSKGVTNLNSLHEAINQVIFTGFPKFKNGPSGKSATLALFTVIVCLLT